MDDTIRFLLLSRFDFYFYPNGFIWKTLYRLFVRTRYNVHFIFFRCVGRKTLTTITNRRFSDYLKQSVYYYVLAIEEFLFHVEIRRK